MNSLILTIIILILIVIILCYYIGLFTTINIQISKPVVPVGGHFFYKFYQRQYSEARFAFREIAKYPLKKSFLTVGIYYDDPKKVKEDSTRYAVGIVIRNEELDKELANNFENVGYQHAILPDVNSVVTTSFRLRSMLSILVAINRVYPKLGEFMESKKLDGHPCMEYYPPDISTMHFIVPLEKNQSFYVPEFHTSTVEYIDEKKKD